MVDGEIPELFFCRDMLGLATNPIPVKAAMRMVAEGGLWFEETLKTSFTSMRTVSLTRRESQLVSLLSQGLKTLPPSAVVALVLHAEKEGFIFPEHRKMVCMAETPQELLVCMENHQHPTDAGDDSVDDEGMNP